jgi:hypothetical protein
VVEEVQIVVRAIDRKLDTVHLDPRNPLGSRRAIPFDEAKDPLSGREVGIRLPRYKRNERTA